MQKQGKTMPPNSRRTLPALWRLGALPGDVGMHQGSVSHDAWGGIDQQPLWHWEPPMRLTYHLSGTHTGFDHRIGHFRPLRMATRVTECHIYLRVRGFSLANSLLGWPTP